MTPGPLLPALLALLVAVSGCTPVPDAQEDVIDPVKEKVEADSVPGLVSAVDDLLGAVDVLAGEDPVTDEILDAAVATTPFAPRAVDVVYDPGTPDPADGFVRLVDVSSLTPDAAVPSPSRCVSVSDHGVEVGDCPIAEDTAASPSVALSSFAPAVRAMVNEYGRGSSDSVMDDETLRRVAEMTEAPDGYVLTWDPGTDASDDGRIVISLDGGRFTVCVQVGDTLVEASFEGGSWEAPLAETVLCGRER